MSLRHLIAFGLAAGVTFGLFFLMQFLISMELRWTEPGKGPVIEFVRLVRDSDLDLKKRRLPNRMQPDQPPPPPQLDFSKAARPDQDVGNVMPIFDREVNIAGGMNLGAPPSDTDIIPLVRVNPQYPVRAQSRGIEGWVEIEFTITPSGTVADPVVVMADPPSIFNRAAIRAIQKWKYNPRIEDGQPVSRPGVRVRLTFELEEES